MPDIQEIGYVYCAPSRNANLEIIKQNKKTQQFNLQDKALNKIMEFIEAISSDDQELIKLIGEIKQLDKEQQALFKLYHDKKDTSSTVHHEDRRYYTEASWKETSNIINELFEKRNLQFKKTAEIYKAYQALKWNEYNQKYDALSAKWSKAETAYNALGDSVFTSAKAKFLEEKKTIDQIKLNYEAAKTTNSNVNTNGIDDIVNSVNDFNSEYFQIIEKKLSEYPILTDNSNFDIRYLNPFKIAVHFATIGKDDRVNSPNKAEELKSQAVNIITTVTSFIDTINKAMTSIATSQLTNDDIITDIKQQLLNQAQAFVAEFNNDYKKTEKYTELKKSFEENGTVYVTEADKVAVKDEIAKIEIIQKNKNKLSEEFNHLQKGLTVDSDVDALVANLVIAKALKAKQDEEITAVGLLEKAITQAEESYRLDQKDQANKLLADFWALQAEEAEKVKFADNYVERVGDFDDKVLQADAIAIKQKHSELLTKFSNMPKMIEVSASVATIKTVAGCLKDLINEIKVFLNGKIATFARDVEIIAELKKSSEDMPDNFEDWDFRYDDVINIKTTGHNYRQDFTSYNHLDYEN